MSSAVDLDVVIPSRSSAPRLRATLACLAAERELSFGVVVVDDHDSPAEIRAVLEEAERALPLRVVRGPRGGRAAARNAGAECSTADRLLFLDDDVLVGPGFLRHHAQAAAPGTFVHGRMRELPTAERLLGLIDGAGFPEIQRVRAEFEDTAAPRDPRRRLLANALEQTVEAMAEGTLPDVAPWLGFIGGNTAVERSAFLAAGGFDPDFGVDWGCEDLELGLRLHRLGVRRAFARDAFGIHLSHARPNRWIQHGRTLARFTELHPLPSVRALEHLLGPDGRPQDYVHAARAEPLPVGAGR